MLDVKITTDRELYAPGDLVTYLVTVRDKRTNELVTGRDVLISVVATDESVFSKIEDRK